MTVWWAARLWDVLASAAPLAASALAGSLLAARCIRDDGRPADAGVVVGLGCAAVQAVTWAIALFAPSALAAAWHWTVLAAGGAAMALAMLPWRPAALAPLRRWPVRVGLLAAPLAAFLIAHPNPVGQTPGDALAYHLPAAHWFALGGAWRDLPSLLWTAQLPLASSLWTSFATGAHVPIADPLAAWIAVNVAMVIWTAVILADLIGGAGASRPHRLLAIGAGVAIVAGAYTAQAGFVDYASGLLAVCLVATLAAGARTAPPLWTPALVAGALAECRPQGLLLAAAIAAAAPALLAGRDWRADLGRGQLAPLAATGALAAKWWALVWWRWGTPFVPILGARLGASPEVVNAEAVYRAQWPPTVWPDGLVFTLGPSGIPALAVASWLLIALVAIVAWRSRPPLPRALLVPGALAPVGWAILIVTQSPSQAARMAIVAVPVCVAAAAAIARRQAADPVVRRVWSGALLVMIVVLLAAAPRAWNGQYLQAGVYPTLLGTMTLQARDQLTVLSGLDACLLDQYAAPLPPRGVRYLGGLVPPWAHVPRRLETAADWTAWLRRHGVRALLTKPARPLTGIWMPVGAPAGEHADALDAWVRDCPGQYRSGDWFVCPLSP